MPGQQQLPQQRVPSGSKPAGFTVTGGGSESYRALYHDVESNSTSAAETTAGWTAHGSASVGSSSVGTGSVPPATVGQWRMGKHFGGGHYSRSGGGGGGGGGGQPGSKRPASDATPSCSGAQNDDGSPVSPLPGAPGTFPSDTAAPSLSLEDGAGLWEELAVVVRYVGVIGGKLSCEDAGHSAGCREAGGAGTAGAPFARYRGREFTLRSTRQLEQQLVFCGIKKHRCGQALTKLIASLLRACFPSPAPATSVAAAAGTGSNEDSATPSPAGTQSADQDQGSSRNNNNKETSTSAAEEDDIFIDDSNEFPFVYRVGKAECKERTEEGEKHPGPIAHVSLEELLFTRVEMQVMAAAAGQESTQEQSATASTTTTAASAASRHRHHNVAILLDAGRFERAVVSLLSTQLRGQMLTVTPAARWRATAAVARGSPPLVVFCGGTSGSGKSTTAALLAAQLGITHVVSTDTVRQVLRSGTTREACPVLFASTYDAHRGVRAHASGGEVAANANTNPADGKDTPAPSSTAEKEKGAEEKPNTAKTTCDNTASLATTTTTTTAAAAAATPSGAPTSAAVVDGFLQQSELVLATLDRMIDRVVARRESLLVEGVHLLPAYMQRKREELHGQNRAVCLPFMLQIGKEEKHRERFATRAKCMSLQPNENKYVHSFEAIRAIQSYLIDSAAAGKAIVILSNTNIDRSVMLMQTAILRVLDKADLARLSDSIVSLFQLPSTAGAKKTLPLLLRRREEKRVRGDAAGGGASGAGSPSAAGGSSVSRAGRGLLSWWESGGGGARARSAQILTALQLRGIKGGGDGGVVDAGGRTTASNKNNNNNNSGNSTKKNAVSAAGEGHAGNVHSDAHVLATGAGKAQDCSGATGGAAPVAQTAAYDSATAADGRCHDENSQRDGRRKHLDVSASFPVQPPNRSHSYDVSETFASRRWASGNGESSTPNSPANGAPQRTSMFLEEELPSLIASAHPS